MNSKTTAFHKLAYESYFEHPLRSQVLTYVELLCNQDNQLSVTHPDYQERQRHCAMVAGIDIESTEGVLMLSMNDRSVNDLMDLYLTKVQSSRPYNALLSNEIFFDELMKVVREPLTTSDEEKKLKSIIAKATAAEKASDCLQRIDAYTKQVYGEHKEHLDEAKERLTPESIAKRNKSNL